MNRIRKPDYSVKCTEKRQFNGPLSVEIARLGLRLHDSDTLLT
jgi:hypothetical protein